MRILPRPHPKAVRGDEVLDLADRVVAELVLVAGFLRARESQLSSIPKTADGRGRAFPTPRTWDYAARLSAFAQAVGRARRCAAC
jgi:hypothetical protein